jgi:hypothetical protein
MNKITIDEFFKSKEKLAIYPGTNMDDLKKMWQIFKNKTHHTADEFSFYFDLYDDEICFGNDKTFCSVDLYEQWGYRIIRPRDLDLS